MSLDLSSVPEKQNVGGLASEGISGFDWYHLTMGGHQKPDCPTTGSSSLPLPRACSEKGSGISDLV